MSNLRKQMECYRPGLDDLSEPELAALNAALDADPSARHDCEIVQAWDSAISRAITDIPIPDGLADRIVASVHVGRPSKAATDEISPTPSRSAWRLPWPAWAAAGVTAATLLLVAGLWILRGGDNLTGADIAQAARGWVAGLDQENWSESSPPADHRPDPSLRFPAVRWQRFAAGGVAYYGELPPDRSAAYLLVIRTRQGSQLPSLPPATPDASTEGLCIGSWKNQGLLYVLVVPGDQARYRRLLRTHGLPIT